MQNKDEGWPKISLTIQITKAKNLILYMGPFHGLSVILCIYTFVWMKNIMFYVFLKSNFTLVNNISWKSPQNNKKSNEM